MKGTQAAVVLGVGYLLGRRRKLRTATVVAAAAATGGAGSLGGTALRRGLKKLGSSEVLGDLGPQLSEIGEIARGDLVKAGKAAAVASVSNRIGSLSDTLRDRTEMVRNPASSAADAAGAAGEGAADAAGEAGDTVKDLGRRAPRGAGRPEPEPEPEPGRRAPRGADRPEPEPEDEYEDEPEDQYEGEEGEYDGEPEEDKGEARLRRRAPRRSPVSRSRR